MDPMTKHGKHDELSKTMTLFHDAKWTKFLVIHFFQRFYYFEVLSVNSYFIFNLEV
jgi:hypothetical protein